MHVWIVMTGEAVPTDGKGVRLRRAATLATICAQRGHEVTWWTSTFNHQLKTQRSSADKTVTTEDGIRLEMLHAPAYARNVSVGRLINHKILGRSLDARIRREPPPDVILCAWPTIEFSVVCVEYGTRTRTPVIIDVRDLWPDIFVDVVPRPLQPVLRRALYPMVSSARRVFHECTAIAAISPGYLDWALQYANRPRKPLDVVFPLGYDRPCPPDKDVRDARRALIAAGVDPSRNICLFVGVFGATYDLSTVIRAAALLSRQGRNDLQFVLAGTGERESEWRRMANGLTNVTFTGWVDGARIAFLAEVSQLGLAAYAPSAPQGLPNKLYEYMAFGLPVVSSLSGEAQVFLAESCCGLTYAAGDAESLTSAILRLMGDTQLRLEYSANGRRIFETRFRADKVYSAMVDYLETVQQSPGAAALQNT